MIALVDADIVTYRCGYVTEQDEEWIAAARVDELIFSIMEETQATSSRLFLTSTDKSNFRYQIYPEYKANRKQPKPKHYEFIRKYLVEQYKAEVVYGEEADDALGYSQTENILAQEEWDRLYGNKDLTNNIPNRPVDTIICSVDKDLLMIPGNHYNFVKKELYTISPQEGMYNFYWQLLNGDAGDNIPGCPGVGPKTIEKLIHSDMSEEELFSVVRETYLSQYIKKQKLEALEEMLRNGQLLKIKQEKDEPVWQFPYGQ